MTFRPVARTDDPFWRVSSGTDRLDEPVADFINTYKSIPTGHATGHAVPTSGYDIASGENIGIGDLVRLDASDEIVELSAITQTVKGVAMDDVVAGVTLGPASDIVLVARASYTHPEHGRVIKTIYAVVDVNGTVPLPTHVGTQCALDLTGGEWTIDVSDTSNVDVVIVQIDTARGEFLVKFLDAVVQT